MTTTMPEQQMRAVDIRHHLKMGAIILLALSVIMVGILLWCGNSDEATMVDLEQVQKDLIQDLTDHQGEYDERSIVLSGTDRVTAKQLAKTLGAELRITSDGSFATLTLPEGVTFLDIAQAEEYLTDLPRMSIDYQARISEITEEDSGADRLPMRPQYTVTDGSYELQTYLDYLNLKNLWVQTQGAGVTVAVIDTGIDTDHPEFAGRISEYSYNATEDKIVKDYTTADGSYDWSLIEDEQGHGTAVAGVIGASMGSGEIVGIAPRVTILVIKAECDENGAFKRASDLVFGLYYAIERDVDVVNMSFGSPDPSNPFADPAQLAVDSDIVCVAAAGNEESAVLTYPAADENVFGIGALAADSWELAEYSNYGENVDFVAPGTTYTAKMGGTYAVMDGTSFACPATVGVIALYLSQNRYQEVSKIEELLRASCYDLGDLGPDWYYGYGAIDAYALISAERGTVTFNMMTDELENTEQIFIRNQTLQNMPEPERLYAIFDGWYYDPQCTEEYVWYEDEFSADLTLYANWVNEEDGVPYIYVELEDGTIEIRAYTGRRRYITIPDYIDGKIVSSIGEDAFAGETRLREVNLPKYLVRIRDRAFSGCANLIHMNIPDTVTEIGAEAFADNVRLSSVAFGEGSKLEKIGDYAFSGCGKIRNFTVPKHVEYLNGSAFCGTSSMISYSVQEGNRFFLVREGVLFNMEETTLVAYPAGRGGEYTIPAHVAVIGVDAFAYAKITGVNLANVQQIESGAFQCGQLVSVSIPDNVTELGKKTFYLCQSLRTVEIGHGLTQIPDEAFSCCFNLQAVKIPYTIRKIGKNAFELVPLYQGVTFELNSTLEVIESMAFYRSGISSVAIPSSVQSIGGLAFSSTALQEITFAAESDLRTIGDKAFEKTYISKIDLPHRLETIGAFAFTETKLQEVTLPANLTLLGEGAFASCCSLENIFVDDANAVYADVDGVVYDIEKSTLVEYPAGNMRGHYVVLQSVTAIGEAAFHGSWQIRSVQLPDALQEIRREAFCKCQNLSVIAIPDSVVQISNYAFAEDWNLHSVTFTENSQLPRISYEAFAYCGLTSFRVPSNVSTIAQGAFKGCSKLTSFTFAKNSKLESISAYMFNGCSNLRSITFEEGSALTSIQAHGLEGMTKLESIYFGDAKITNIDNFAFRFCESLTRVDIPEGVTNLGRFAFYECTLLAEVQIPTTMEHIGKFAFLGTKDLNVYFASEMLPSYMDEDWDYGTAGYYLGVTDIMTDGDWKYAQLTSGNIAIIEYLGESKELDLTTLQLGGDIVNIGGKAFYYSSVERIQLPQTLAIIQAEAFYHSALTSVVIPQSVQFIGRSAFADTPITSLTFAGNSELTVMEQFAFEGTKELGSVVLPKSLTTIGRAIFKNSGIRSLTFADGIGITEISEEAFAYTDIQTLKLPDSITLINHNAFRNTAQLESVSFGSAEFMVMSNAFYQSGLTSLHIPANMTYVGEYAFVALPRLTEFTVDAKNPYYTTIDGLLVGQNGRKLIAVPAGREGSLTVPAGIEVIGFGAFEDSKLSEITFLPNANILSFGYRAFYNAKNITTMHIPASVVAIDYYAFANCSALETVTFAPDNGLNGVYEGAFYGCKDLTNIELPDGVDEISDFAFYGCRKLTRIPVSENSEIKGIYGYAMAYSGLRGELTTPETLYDIGEYAFLGTRVTKVTIPDTNAWDLVIGIGAFEECNMLEEITLPFIGASFEDMDITWFGYIFGAGGYMANSTYVPESLKKVNITEGLTTIGTCAFYQLDGIEEIDVPHSVTAIYSDAFEKVKARYTLTNIITPIRVDYPRGESPYVPEIYHFGSGLYGHIELSDQVTEIGERAFYECSEIMSITLPSSVTNIGGRAFCGCEQLTSITIPDGVVTVEESAFYDCTNLTNIVIPEGVVTVGDVAFARCTNLTNIVIPESVTSIGENAFWSCSSLNSITIPHRVTNIGEGAFSGCNELYVIYNNSDLPLTIGSDAYGGIAKNAKLMIDKHGNKTYRDESTDFAYLDTPDGFRFKVENGEYTLIAYLGDQDTVTLPTDIQGNAYEIYHMRGVRNVVIPEGVTSIGDSAFYECNGLTSITLSDSVTSIGDEAFRECSSLTSIMLPDSVTSIGANAFRGCSSLTSITLPDGLTSISDYMFSYCTGLTSVVIPDSVTSIGWHAFSECSGLTSISIPDSVTSIAEYMFSGCSSLTSIMLPESVTSIGDGAFYGCSSLTSISIPDSVTSIGVQAFSECSGLTSISIPDSVTSIARYMFSGCSSLTSITIPDSVEYIFSGAFMNCTSLKNMEIPKSVKRIESGAFDNCHFESFFVSPNNTAFHFEDGILYNKDQTSIVCVLNGITAAHIPAAVTDISGAFAGNTTLQTISFAPDSRLSVIGNSTFSGCSSLTSIIIPDSVTSIGYSAFSGCSSLTSITIPDSVTSIRDSAFSGCSGLTSISIPDSVTSIGREVFSGCSSLTSITIPDSVTSIGDWAFSECSSLMSITIPDSVTSIGWAAFSGCSGLTSISIPDGVTSIDGLMFSGCSSLTSITIPDSVTSIGRSAFLGCSSLTSIIIPDSVTSIGGSAFSKCSSLMSITILDSVTSIGAMAFSECGALISITLPDGLTSISDDMFFDCTGLTSVVIPDSVTSIAHGAFSSCANLYVVYNNSDLQFTFGSSDSHGGVAYYAKLIVDKHGNKIYRDESANFAYVDTPDGFRFAVENGKYTLIAYIGDQDTVTLPRDIRGNSYEIHHMSGMRNVIVPDGITSISNFAFQNCGGLVSITLPDSVTKIGSGAFIGTAYYENPDNWDNGTLYIGNHLIAVSKEVTSFELRKGTVSIDRNIFWDCYSLKKIVMGGNHDIALYGVTNLETLVITEMPTVPVLYYFGWQPSALPLTLRDVVLTEGVAMHSHAFDKISGITIYVEATEKETMWDENCPGWNNGNRVIYGDQWIYANFYQNTGEVKSTGMFTTSQIIRVPWMDDYVEGDYIYTFQGFDIDADGIADTIPATSTNDISGYAVYSREHICDKYGHNYGQWHQTVDPSCTQNGEERRDCDVCAWFETREVEAIGHSYQIEIMSPTCTEQGYTTYTCHCGDTYVSDYIDAAGHKYQTEVTAPTCTEQGYTTYHCQCGDCYVDGYTDAVGHTYGAWYQTKAPSCMNPGEERQDCENCGHSEHRTVVAISHMDDNADGACDMCLTQLTNEPEVPNDTPSDTKKSSYAIVLIPVIAVMGVAGVALARKKTRKD